MITFPNLGELEEMLGDGQPSTSGEKTKGKKSKKRDYGKQQREAKEKLKPVGDLLCDPNVSFNDLSELL